MLLQQGAKKASGKKWLSDFSALNGWTNGLSFLLFPCTCTFSLVFWQQQVVLHSKVFKILLYPLSYLLLKILTGSCDYHSHLTRKIWDPNGLVSHLAGKQQGCHSLWLLNPTSGSSVDHKAGVRVTGMVMELSDGGEQWRTIYCKATHLLHVPW